MSDFEVIFVVWTACGLIWLAGAGRTYRAHLLVVLPAWTPTALMSLVAAKSMAHIVLRRKIAELMSVATLLAIGIPLFGYVQCRRCPHALWLQVFGESYLLEGTPCNNRQPTDPWWLDRIR